MASYAVQLATRYDGLVIATFPDLPGVSALGMDDEEALGEARRALDAALLEYAADGAEAPAPAASGPNMIEAAPVITLAAV
jgi:predicted RNase H-like HicB family nuclease